MPGIELGSLRLAGLQAGVSTKLLCCWGWTRVPGIFWVLLSVLWKQTAGGFGSGGQHCCHCPSVAVPMLGTQWVPWGALPREGKVQSWQVRASSLLTAPALLQHSH